MQSRNRSSENEPLQHQRSDIPCPKQDSLVSSEGITPKQEQELRRKRRGQTDIQKWKEIYRILFPGESQIPSPCKFNMPMFDGQRH